MGRLACDDGNVARRDGYFYLISVKMLRCTNTCGVEAGWTCSGGGSLKPDKCFETCSDNIDWGTLPCEDGIINAGG